jgi:Domain of unknown function (DUF5060)
MLLTALVVQRKSSCELTLTMMMNRFPMLLSLFLLSFLTPALVAGTEIVSFTLVNSVTSEALAQLNDDAVVDVRIYGRELTITADVSNDTVAPYLVKLQLDGSKKTISELMPPYSLGGDRDGKYASVLDLAVLGTHNVTAAAFDAAYQGLASKTVYFTVVERGAVTALTLVNAATGTDIGPLVNSTIDLFVTGTMLSIRAEVADMATSFKFVYDGTAILKTQRPYTLGDVALNGDGTYQYLPVAALAVPGNHLITATATDLSGREIGSLSVAFTVMKRASTTGAGTYKHSPTGALTGELRKWHKITLGFDGPFTNVTASPNPFTNYRLDVTFTQASSGAMYRVPGYYAADGNAANTGAKSGPVWLVHFAPDTTGIWSWVASFKQGANVAQTGVGVSAGYFNGMLGSFAVMSTNKSGRDLRGKGLLRYVEGKHHLQFAETGEWFLKAGADSPENFLAYEDFENTPNYGGWRKSWAPHKQDFNSGDPTWAGGKGTGIIGAINYLSEQGMRSFSFLTMNIGGDDKNVFPYISSLDHLRIDVSKTAQWEIVFQHADRMGMFLHFKTQETENDQLLDGGALGIERKLYYRELIARFGHHLALNWNLGEENTNTDAQRKQFADWIRAIDPYNHPIVVHTLIADQSKVYGALYGYPSFEGASIQAIWNTVFEDTLARVTESAAAGRPWVVANDEQGNQVLFSSSEYCAATEDFIDPSKQSSPIIS